MAADQNPHTQATRFESASAVSPRHAPTVGFIGLGRMGLAIAHNVHQAGYRLRVFNRSPERAQSLVAAGAELATTPSGAAHGAGVIITSLLDDRAVRDVVHGENGLLSGMAPGAVHVATTTVSPALTRELERSHRARSVGFVAAPVLGRPDAAARGELLSIVAGDPEHAAACRPVIEAYSRSVVELGHEPAQASSLKLALNFYVVAMLETYGELIGFTDASGLDTQLVHDLLASLQGHPGILGYLKRISERDFDDAGFELTTGLKDVELMRAAAQAIGHRLPIADVAQGHLASAIDLDMGHRDWSALTELARATS
jgi:3-hydroxyisobutyrate dehydrogenase-like beta-hydroxyacid dehydrogenase